MIKPMLAFGVTTGAYIKGLFGLLAIFPMVPAGLLFWASFPLVMLVLFFVIIPLLGNRNS